MGFDMVVALPGTTPEGQTLFGYNGSRPANEGQSLHRQRACGHTPGETLLFGNFAVPQPRQTHTVVGWQSQGMWGVRHGVNEHGVVAGCCPIRTRLREEGLALTGPDLVRLALERTCSSRQARDVILDFVSRHGQSAPPDEEPNNTFLVADLKEAFVLETSGRHWAEQEVHAVRAVSDVCHLHQDWNRISRGLAEFAIGRSWWPEDGSKLDFADVVAPNRPETAAMRRWGRATLLMEQQSGRVDAMFLRRLLSDHYESPAARPANDFASVLAEQAICQHAVAGAAPATSASLIVEMRSTPEPMPLAWCAFGPPCTSVYFPILLTGELPGAFQVHGTENGCAVWQAMGRLLQHCQLDPQQWKTIRKELTLLQSHFDENCRDVLSDAAQLHHNGKQRELERLSESFMQHNVECFDGVCERLCPTGARREDKGKVSATVRHVEEDAFAGTF
jgi:secernin